MSSIESSTSTERGERFDRSTIDQNQTVDELLLDQGSEHPPTISIVLPTLNEQEGIKICLDKIRRTIETLQITAEIIVSDSSTDMTPAIARANGAIVVKPDEPGYGQAYKTGFRATRGEYVAMGDADATYDFEALPELLQPVMDGDADLVLGSRFEGEIRPGSMPRLHRYVGNPLLTRFLNVFYDADVTDAHSGFRVMSRDALERLDLRSDGMEFASEMVMEAQRRGLTIEEVPITYHKREGEETLNSLRDGWRHVKFMLVNAPGYLFSGPGVATMIAGGVVMAMSTADLRPGGLVFGLHTMIGGSLLTIIGYQVMCFGFFCSVAADPIRKHDGVLTNWVHLNFRLEHGVSLGMLITLVGGLGLTDLLLKGLREAPSGLPSPVWSVLASTFVVLGILTVFSSFFMSILAEEYDS